MRITVIGMQGKIQQSQKNGSGGALPFFLTEEIQTI